MGISFSWEGKKSCILNTNPCFSIWPYWLESLILAVNQQSPTVRSSPYVETHPYSLKRRQNCTWLRRGRILIFGACDRIILVICRIYPLLKVQPRATLIGRKANSLLSSCQSLFYLLKTAKTYLHNNEDKSL